MKYNDGKEQTVTEGIEGTSYVYNATGEEATMTFSLYAVNSAGECTVGAESGQVTAGQAASLPFKESFVNTELEHMGWQKATTQDDEYYTYDAWYFSSEATMYYLSNDEYISILPQDDDKGFASCRFYGYSEDGQTESLISPRMAVGETKNVKVSFYYWNTLEDANKSEVRLYVSRDGGDWENVLSTKPLTEGMPQWEQYSKVLSMEGTTDLRIKLDAVRHDGPIVNISIDNICVEATTETGISSITTGDDSQARTDYFTISGTRINRPTAPGTYIVRTGKSVKKVVLK